MTETHQILFYLSISYNLIINNTNILFVPQMAQKTKRAEYPRQSLDDMPRVRADDIHRTSAAMISRPAGG
jgi:hypothetical protein